jgi:hypothetical protein
MSVPTTSITRPPIFFGWKILSWILLTLLAALLSIKLLITNYAGVPHFGLFTNSITNTSASAISTITSNINPTCAPKSNTNSSINSSPFSRCPVHIILSLFYLLLVFPRYLIAVIRNGDNHNEDAEYQVGVIRETRHEEVRRETQ